MPLELSILDSFCSEMLKISASRRERDLFNRVKKESPVEVVKTDKAEEYGGAYFDPSEEGHIGISDHHFDALAHEVGHAQNHTTIWGKLIQSVPAGLAFALAPLAGAAAGIALAKGKKWPLIIPAAAVTPILLAEAMATNTGHKVLAKVKAKPEEVEKYRTNLRSAFSTYLQTPVATAAVGTLSYLLQKATS
jgi:hypothetical protein